MKWLWLGLMMATVMLGASCDGQTACPDTRPKRTSVTMEESDGWSFNVGHAIIEGHRYIAVSAAHWGGVVHDPKCPCQVQSLPAEQPAGVRP